MVKVSALESAVPGFATVTCAVAADKMSAAVMAAVTWLAETKVVVRAEPFHLTVAPLKKPEPLTVRVKAAPPAVAEVGLRLVSAGGLDPLPAVASYAPIS